jgi:hypothetical protein
VTGAHDRRRKGLWLAGASALLVAVGLLIAFSSSGVESGRLHNPSPRKTVVYDGVPRADEPFLGVENWPLIWQIVTLVVAAGFWGYFGRLSWRMRRLHPGILLMIASTGMLVFDPIVNWSAFVVFDPRLLHLPASWPYASIAPGVEPIFVMAGYPFYLLIPGLITVALLRRFVAPRLRPGSWADRHPLQLAFWLGLLVAGVFDVAAELSMVRTELWIYSQAAGPVIHVGPHQWPVLWEPLLFSPTMAVTAVMLVRDDAGRTVQQRLVERSRRLRRRPILGQIAVAWVIYAIPYFGLYTGSFSLFRLSGAAISLNDPFPFQETKVYDPQGRFERAGLPGPYYPGIWSGPRVEDDHTARAVVD